MFKTHHNAMTVGLGQPEDHLRQQVRVEDEEAHLLAGGDHLGRAEAPSQRADHQSDRSLFSVYYY
jgi:hypothetical protein